MPKIIRFRDVPVGSTFEFAGVRDFPYSGFARGPWIKSGPGTYYRADEPSFKCKVGTTRAEVWWFSQPKKEV